MAEECLRNERSRVNPIQVQHDGLARGEEEADSDRWLSKHSGAMISRVAQWLVVNGLETERIQEHMLHPPTPATHAPCTTLKTGETVRHTISRHFKASIFDQFLRSV